MSSEKTEEPSDKRLEEARRKGQVAKSREFTTATILLAIGGSLLASGTAIIDELKSFVAGTMRLSGSADPLSMLYWGGSTAMAVLAPLLSATVVASVAGHILQTGPVFADKALEPNLGKLNFIKGLGQLFTRRKLIELVKTLLKILLIGTILVSVFEDGIRAIGGLSASSPEALVRIIGELASRLLFRVAGAIGLLAIADIFYQRWQHRRDQRMTKEEVKREHKDAEGDPQTQGERARLRREIAEHGAVQEVHRADVLVVNPTHLAIALRYDEDANDAPMILSKGEDHLARRMMDEARRAGVPIMRDVPLARALYELERGEEIPEALFEAVAAVLRAAWAERDEDHPSEPEQ